MSRFNASSFAVAAGIGLLLTSSAEAAIAGPPLSQRLAATGTGLVVKAQYVFGGQNYCWYLNGWEGPGWYWCGYAWEDGIGWGGGYGWNGWGGGRGRIHSGRGADGRQIPGGAPGDHRNGGALGGSLGGHLSGAIGGRIGGHLGGGMGGGHGGGMGGGGGGGHGGGGGGHGGGGGGHGR